jgi:hypothetical protein
VDETIGFMDEYLSAAQVAIGLLSDPLVGSAWERHSALDRMTVGGLAAHLSQQISFVPQVLASPVEGEPITLLEHYSRVEWRGADLDQETNVGIRKGSEALAEHGPQEVAEHAAGALTALHRALPAEPPDRVVYLAYAGWALTLEDYLTTRMMEIAVHCDDLAVSVGLPTPQFPPRMSAIVIDLLVRLATQRHGATTVIRALSRAERAPATIAAI